MFQTVVLQKDAEFLQNYLVKEHGNMFKIMIFGTCSYTKLIFNGKVKKAENVIPIFFHNDHFYEIKNLNKFVTGKTITKYCTECLSIYSKKIEHCADCDIKCCLCGRHGSEFPCEKTNFSKH